MAETNNSVSVTLSGVTEVSGQLTNLATNIQATLNAIKATVGMVAEGAINGDAPGELINQYTALHAVLCTYPERLTDMAASLSKSGDIYQAVDAEATDAASGK